MRRLLLLASVLTCSACVPRPTLVHAVPHALPLDGPGSAAVEATVTGVGGRLGARVGRRAEVHAVGHRATSAGFLVADSLSRSVQGHLGGGVLVRLRDDGRTLIALSAQASSGRVRAAGAESAAQRPCDPEAAGCAEVVRGAVTRGALGLVASRSEALGGPAEAPTRVTVGLAVGVGGVRASGLSAGPVGAAGPRRRLPSESAPTVEQALFVRLSSGRVTVDAQGGSLQIVGDAWGARFRPDAILLSLGLAVRIGR